MYNVIVSPTPTYKFKSQLSGIYIYKENTGKLYYLIYILPSPNPFDIQPYLCNCFYNSICIGWPVDISNPIIMIYFM